MSFIQCKKSHINGQVVDVLYFMEEFTKVQQILGLGGFPTCVKCSLIESGLPILIYDKHIYSSQYVFFFFEE